MWIVAWTERYSEARTEDETEDFWVVVATEKEAMEQWAKVVYSDGFYCGAVAPIKHGSEPHYTEHGDTIVIEGVIPEKEVT